MSPKLRNPKSKLQKVEEYGRKYSQEHLTEKPEELLSDWQKALCFFLSRVFPGGRPDKLSKEYLGYVCGWIKDRSPNRGWNKDSLLSLLKDAERSLKGAGVKKRRIEKWS